MCNNCKCDFDEPRKKRTSYEAEFGVAHLFPDTTNCYIQVCPMCGSDDIEELTMCRYCHQWVREEDLDMIEGIENLNFACPRCQEIYGSQNSAK